MVKQMDYKSTLFLLTFLLDEIMLQNLDKSENEGDIVLKVDLGYSTTKLNMTNAFQINSTLDEEMQGSNKSSTEKLIKVTRHHHIFLEQTSPWIPNEPPRKLPLSIIIAGPTAAVSIMLFLCIAFYFHNAQLNKKAERLSFSLYMIEEPSIDVSIPGQKSSPSVPVITTNGLPSVQTMPYLPRNCSSPSINGTLPRNYSVISMGTYRDTDKFSQQRKSTVSLGLPPRSTALSAYTDQEIAKQSSKRKHSVFIL